MLKVRIHARGDLQSIMSFLDSWAPTSRYASVRIVLTYATRLGRKVRIFDVDAAYLNSDLNEEIYVRPVEGFLEAPEGFVIPLLKPLYGLRQAGACFYKSYSTIFEDFGAVAFVKEAGVWQCNKNGRSFLLAAFVDDWTIAGDDTLIDEFIAFVGKKFTIKEQKIKLNEPFLLLGMELLYKQVHGKLQLKITADRVTKTILERSDTSLEGAPPMPAQKLHKCITEVNKDLSSLLTREQAKKYQVAVGGLMFLAVTCRADLSYAVGALAVKMSSPTQAAQKALVHTLKYVNGSINTTRRKYDLIFREVEDASQSDFKAKQHVNLIAYVDASHSTPRSTSGYVFFWDGNLIDWASKRQKLTQLSTTSAEWDSLALCVSNALYLKDFMHHIGYSMSNEIQIAEDNTGVIRWAQELYRGQFNRRKHIELRTFFINDAIRHKYIKVVPVSTKDQCADPFTKQLDYKTHQAMFQRILNYDFKSSIPISNPLEIY